MNLSPYLTQKKAMLVIQQYEELSWSFAILPHTAMLRIIILTGSVLTEQWFRLTLQHDTYHTCSIFSTISCLLTVYRDSLAMGIIENSCEFLSSKSFFPTSTGDHFQRPDRQLLMPHGTQGRRKDTRPRLRQ